MTKTYTQADVDAAVAAFAEKAAQTLEEKAKSTRERWNRAPTLSAKITCRHHWEALEASANIVSTLIPTDALAELDAKVRADALREAATICAEHEETFERREANGAAHGAGMCFKAIQALIEGEA